MALGASSCRAQPPPSSDKPHDTLDWGEHTFDAWSGPSISLYPYFLYFLVCTGDSASAFNWGWGRTNHLGILLSCLFSLRCATIVEPAYLGILLC